ncbi:ABC transporter ATP-binding protein [Propionibacteriaceae bacterium G1746]|uniref:ABC transporter ATP-binding protein n=1 Tax=Aestuariimicrobium sp. G57 TaxID=3418485 RepID=UPI003C1304ED
MSIIRTEALVKTFGPTRALDGLDLVVEPGEVHGFLGPNGAGKSTTIRILLGLMRHDSGTARLFDRDPWREAVELHKRLAYVPGDVTLWPGLTGGQCIDVLAAAHGDIDTQRRDDLIERFELDPTKKSRSYSKGNRQKVSLVAALSTHVELLLLDEPTSGLDPLMERVFQDVITERRADGVTVLLSSHIMGEVEALADRVSIIREGRLASSGTLADLRRHTRSHVHALTLRPPALPASADLALTADGDRTEVNGTIDADHVGQLVAALHDAGLHTLTVTPPSLDDLFLTNYADAENAPLTSAGAR